MNENEILNVLTTTGNVCVRLGVFNDIDSVRRYISILDHFEKMDYQTSDEYYPDFNFICDVFNELQKTGRISLPEAHTLYELIKNIENVEFSEVIEDGVINASDIA